MRISDWSSDVCSSDLIRPYTPLFTRIDPKQIAAMTEASKEDLKPTAAAKSEGAVGAAEAATGIPAAAAGAPSDALAKAGSTPATIGIDDFAKLDKSEERRVGTECVHTCRCRGVPKH